MRKRNKTAIIFIAIMTAAAVFLSGCNSAAPEEQNNSPQENDNNDAYVYVPGIHEAYGISYAVPDTEWIYMFNAEQFGSGDELIDMEITGKEADDSLEAVWKEEGATEDSGSETIDGRECYWYNSVEDDSLTKVLLIPQSDDKKYIEIRSDFIDIRDKEKADAFFTELLEGMKFTGEEGYKACSDYLLVGGVRIPAAGMKPVQFFYGEMDVEAEDSDGMASVQVDFDEENYEKGAEKTFAEMKWTDLDLLGDGPFEADGIEGKWYTCRDSLPDSMTYMTHAVMIPNDETKTLMRIEYNFNADVDDISIYDDRITELDGQIHAVK